MDDDQLGHAPAIPYDELKASIGADPVALARLDALRDHLGEASPNRGRIEEHVGALRGFANIEAQIATWWESPPVQRFVNNLTNAGL